MPEHTNATIEVFSDIICELGESALWDAGRSRFYWVDITRPTVCAREWASGITTALAMPDTVGSVALRSGPGWWPRCAT
jgi:sugar lactone lactonase YvrE